MPTENEFQVEPLDDPEEVPAEVDSSALDRSGSMLERIKAHRKELVEDNTIRFLVPGYHGDLAIRYRAIPGEESEKIAGKIGKKSKPNLVVAMDFLIRCCDAVLIRKNVEDDEEPEGDAFEQLGGNDPVRLGKRLAEVMGFEATSAHEAVLGLFSPNRNKDLAVASHAMSLLSWMQGQESEIDEGLLGE